MDDADHTFDKINTTFSTRDIRTVYSFEKLIGGGHFGSVRIAHRITDPEIKYAVKSILKENIKKDIKLLEEELAILSTVDHPNIIRYHETYSDFRYVHIVMELCTGGELFEKIVAEHKFNEQKAASLMRKILSSIKHLHEIGICHRDLKPENFLYATKSEDPEIKLIDFGLSKRWGPDDVEMITIVGTPYYVAPEVLRGHYDNECDVWSMGVIMFILLCGYPPFEGDNNKEIFKRVLQQKLEFDPEDWTDISAEAKDLITKMLEKEPAKRITAIDALNHKWFEKIHKDESLHKDVMHRLQQFRAPQRLQLEALKFLVSNVAQDVDFKNMLDSFRALDTENTGILSVKQIGESLKDDAGISPADKEKLMKELELFHSGKINYSDFLTTAIDKRKTLTMHNL